MASSFAGSNANLVINGEPAGWVSYWEFTNLPPGDGTPVISLEAHGWRHHTPTCVCPDCLRARAGRQARRVPPQGGSGTAPPLDTAHTGSGPAAPARQRYVLRAGAGVNTHPEDVEAMLARLALWESGEAITLVLVPGWWLEADPAPPRGDLDALVAVLKLTDDERAFLGALAESPADRPTLMVLADWLAERGRDDEAEAFKELAGEAP
jgi:uncharacterized protein (TIGR02996 family)